jgi:predicted dehydrogenase
MQRREFIKTVGKAGAGAVIATTALSYSRIYGANARVNLGWIGCGGRGRAVTQSMNGAEDVEFIAVADVYETNMGTGRELYSARSGGFSDFRRVLDMADVNAVVVTTPDHWHCIPTIMACEAGKDVYVEKPLGHNIREGRAMIDAARRTNRVVQTGTQQRSAPHFERMREIVQSGGIGKVYMCRIWNYINDYRENIVPVADSEAPAGLDWDMYLGPAPTVAFNSHRFLGSFRWYYDYAGGRVTDWGNHRFDSFRQVMQVDSPKTVTAAGGLYVLKDGRDTPDILQVTYEFDNFVLSYEANMLNAFGMGYRTPDRPYYRANGPADRPNGLAFYGTSATIFADRLGFEVYPETPSGFGRGGRRGGAPAAPPAEAVSESGGTTDAEALRLHTANFIDCVRTRNRPNADVEIGHLSSALPHLGNVSYRAGGHKLQWDAQNEICTGDEVATRFLGREARAPWNLVTV